ncbi:MAG TPA: ABC transporter substrate-binding protein [Ruminiclostridium sp.]
MSKFRKVKVLCSLMIVVSMLLGLLSGCGSNGSTNANSTSANTSVAQSSEAVTPATPAETELKKGPVKLIWYVDVSPQVDKGLVVDEVNKITQAKINTTLELNFIDWGEYDQKMKMIIASGEPWDMCMAANWANNYIDNVNKGAFLDVSELLPIYAPTVYKDVPVSIWDASKRAGKLFGITNGYSSNSNGLLVMKSIADKYNFDVSKVKSLYDIEPLLEKIKQNDKTLTPLAMDKTGYVSNLELTLGYEPLVNSDIPCAIALDDTVGTIMNQFELPSFKAHILKMSEWYNKGYIKKDAATLERPAEEQKAGLYPVVVAPMYFPTVEADQSPLFGGAPLVAAQLSDSYFSTGTLTGGLTAFNASGTNTERAIMLYELIHNTKDLYNMLSIGIEGKHYTKLAEDATTNRIEIDPIANSAYNPNIFWEFGDGQHAYFVNKGTAFDTPDKKAAFYAAGKNDVAFGFSFDSTSVKTQLAKCHAVSDEYYPALVTGSVDVEKTLPIYLEKLKNAGGDEIIAEAQKQFDAWKKSK